MTYWLYVNWPRKKARIHEARCGSCNHGQGVHKGKGVGNDVWLGPFTTLDAAEIAAGLSGQPITKCKRCLPEST